MSEGTTLPPELPVIVARLRSVEHRLGEIMDLVKEIREEQRSGERDLHGRVADSADRVEAKVGAVEARVRELETAEARTSTRLNVLWVILGAVGSAVGLMGLKLLFGGVGA